MSDIEIIQQQPCIGLFGTCGASTYREDILIPQYEAADIDYYNPQVPEGTWDPSMAVAEADHLRYDAVQTWPVTNETYGLKSLGEQGFAIAASIRSESPLPHFVIPMIELDLDPELSDEKLRKESLGARRLMSEHLRKTTSPNVFVVDSIEEMAETSISLYHAAELLIDLAQSSNPAYQRFMEGRDEQAAYRLALESGKLGADVWDIAK